MFKKIFKYDFQYIFRLWRVLAIVAVATNVLSVIAMAVLISCVKDPYFYDKPWAIYVTLICVLFFIVAILSTSALIICNYVFPLMRYHQNLCTDRAYLTYSLPVKREYHVLSKILVALLQIYANAILLGIIIAVYVAVAASMTGNFQNLLKALFDFNGFTFYDLFQIICSLVISFLSNVLILTFLFLLMQNFAVRKKGAKIGVVLIIVMFYFAYQVFSVIIAYGLIFAIAGYGNIVSFMMPNLIQPMFIMTELAVIALLALLVVIAYFRLLHKVENRLNLG